MENQSNSTIFWIIAMAIQARCLIANMTQQTIWTPRGNVVGAFCPLQPEVVKFLGIPFAQPPVGALRFAPPLPHIGDYSFGLHNATKQPSACPQPGQNISEDCLYLNIWAPAAALRTSEFLPVRVFIHGGSFKSGSASIDLYSGCNTTAATNSIQVNIQYRLGPFGFLSHPATMTETGTTGNFGTLDQAMALEWIKNNIGYFGGDPSRVLLFGESAGAQAVAVQVSRSATTALFSSAISESGAMAVLETAHESYVANTLPFSRALGCRAVSDMAELVCLRSKSVAELVAATPPDDPAYLLLRKFRPVVDGQVVERQPLESVVRGDYNRVPYMLGTNAQEGTLFLLTLYQGAPARISEDDLWDFLEKVGTYSPRLNASRVVESYPLSKFSGSQYPRYMQLAQIWTDFKYVCPTYATLAALSQQGTPVFSYLFNHTSSCSVFPGLSPQLLGAGHGTELPFVFGNSCGFNEDESGLAKEMGSAWASMARNGYPEFSDGKAWPPWDPILQELSILDTPEVRLKSCDLTTRCSVFDEFLDIESGDLLSSLRG